MRIVALKRLSDAAKTLTFSELFFHVVNEVIVNEKVVCYSGKCLLCGDTIKCFQKKEGNFVWQRRSFIDHLKARHYVTSGQIEQEFNCLSDLKNDVAGGKTITQSSISAFLSSKRAAPDTPSVEPAPKIPFLAAPLPEERNIVLFLPRELGESVGYFPINSYTVMKVMRVIVTDIALTWRRRGTSLHLYWDTEIASYGVIDKYLPTIYGNVKAMLKCLTTIFTDYSFSCDCWSTLKVGFKAVCFFLHVYFEKQYYSFLLDVVPIEDGSAFSIDESFKKICAEYGLSPKALITTDNASSNVACFKESRLCCMAHSINTACRHLTADTEKETRTYKLTLSQRREIRDFFETAKQVCQLFRGPTYSVFLEWFEEKKSMMSDLCGLKLKQPVKPCETRWLEIMNYLEWLREYGVAALCVLDRVE